MKIGLIGAGKIGEFLLRAINHEGKAGNARICWLLDERMDAYQKLPKIANQYGCQWINHLEDFLQTDADLVIECTEPSVAKKYVLQVAGSGKNLLVASVGVFADETLMEKIINKSSACGSHIYVPSGAVGGLDAITAGNALGNIEFIKLTTRKPPQAFSEELRGIKQPITLFTGNAREAIQRYPKNINVAITLSLAGIGVEKTEVEIVADPALTKNTHEISVSGKFGRMKIVLENSPFPDHPKTSYLAALSVLATIQRLNNPMKIGG